VNLLGRSIETGTGVGIDQSIAQVAAKLDTWFDTHTPTFSSTDRAAQGKAIDRGVALSRELDELKSRGLKALTKLLEDHDSLPQDRQTAALLAGFKFGARLADVLHDELLDTDGETKVVRLMRAIVNALDEIDPARLALATLLHDPGAGVRAFAGAYLIKLMPERVIPILREIEEKEKANSAHFSASWTLLRWEREGKQTSDK
jgi:hypothetical protein